MWLLDWLFVALTLVLVLIGFVYVDFLRKRNYWKKRGVPYVKPVVLFGNISASLWKGKHISLQMVDLYNQLPGEKFGGIFMMHAPNLMVMDPDLIKTILVKDFSHFHDHGFSINEETEPLQGKSLFVMKGQRWRNMRVKLTPTFTSGKIKRMYHLIRKCGEDLQAHLAEPANAGEVIEVKDLVARFTTNVIASCAFGIQSDCLQDPEDEFRVMGKKLLTPGIAIAFKVFVYMFIPKLGYHLGIQLTPTVVANFFRRVVKTTMEYREKNGVSRNDFLDLLMELKKKGYLEDDKTRSRLDPDAVDENIEKLTDDDVTAQAMNFFTAGFETTATTISFALYELALNPDVQDRLAQEIEAVMDKSDGDLTYDVIQEMRYLDNVISETLRKYPPAAILPRICTKEYTIPGTNVTIEKDTGVQIPIQALHYDPKYYPNPDRFDPDRFDDDIKAKRPHFTYLPFGDGPRVCIGMRFALVQVKVGLVYLLRNHTFSVCDRTVIPIELEPRALVLGAKGGVWLQIGKRDRDH